MIYAINKVRDSGNDKVMITDRGTMFGYRDLIVDYRGIPDMQQFGVPVVLDITHSTATKSIIWCHRRQTQLIETIARAGVAVGVDGFFLETHPDPANAKSDGANMLKLDLLEPMLTRLAALRSVVRSF